MELLGLKLYDLDQERGTVFIRQGKERRPHDPDGERAFAWVSRYLEESRPSLALTPDEGIVFLTNVGLAFEPNRLTQLARDYVGKAEIGKTGACHLFRHTCATLMLENGADIRSSSSCSGTRNWRRPRFTPRCRSACSRKSTLARTRPA